MSEPPSHSQTQRPASAADLFRELAAKKVDHPKAPALYATKAALIFGAILGLVYGLATQFINSMLTPGVPYAHHPFGILGNCLASMLGMLAVCLVCSLPRDAYRGALLGSFTAVAWLEIRALFLGMPLLPQLLTVTSVFVAIGLLLEVVLSIPAMLALRWTIDIQAELFDKPLWAWRRIRWPLAFGIAMAALSIFSAYPDEVRQAMASMVTLIDEGRTTAAANALSDPLRAENGVEDFRAHAQRPYTLELGEESILANDTSPLFHGSIIVIVARFDDGWTLACAYVKAAARPLCRSYVPANAPPITDLKASLLEQQIQLTPPKPAFTPAHGAGRLRPFRGAWDRVL